MSWEHYFFGLSEMMFITRLIDIELKSQGCMSYMHRDPQLVPGTACFFQHIRCGFRGLRHHNLRCYFHQTGSRMCGKSPTLFDKVQFFKILPYWYTQDGIPVFL